MIIKKPDDNINNSMKDKKELEPPKPLPKKDVFNKKKLSKKEKVLKNIKESSKKILDVVKKPIMNIEEKPFDGKYKKELK